MFCNHRVGTWGYLPLGFAEYAPGSDPECSRRMNTGFVWWTKGEDLRGEMISATGPVEACRGVSSLGCVPLRGGPPHPSLNGRLTRRRRKLSELETEVRTSRVPGWPLTSINTAKSHTHEPQVQPVWYTPSCQYVAVCIPNSFSMAYKTHCLLLPPGYLPAQTDYWLASHTLVELDTTTLCWGLTPFS